MRKIAIALALGAASTMIAAPAMAGDPVVRSVRVKVTDEDFASAKSLASLKREIRRAAHKACAASGSSFGPPSREEHQCIEKAIDSANQRLAEIEARHAVAYGG